MKSTGIVRKVDELGRIVLPVELRRTLDIAEKDSLEIYVDDAFLRNAAVDDTCFVENLDFLKYLPEVLSITVYRWNRHYPSDLKFPQLLFDEWRLKQRTDFAGNSHEIITEERYVK